MYRGQQNTGLRMAERLWMERVGVDCRGVPFQYSSPANRDDKGCGKDGSPRDAIIARSYIIRLTKIYPPGGLFLADPGGFLVILHRFFGAGSAVTENIEKGHDGKNPVIPRP